LVIKQICTPDRQRPNPERTCIGCGRRRPKSVLIRLALGEDGQPVIEGRKGAAGRGAYLCGKGCLAAAVKRKVFQRAFRGKMKQLDWKTLEAALEGS
jgi:predicted RNA-binding protein YlxR (DUF448 family)